ncbi:DNA topoisomerase 1 [Batrachochytrium dendrobatidis]
MNTSHSALSNGTKSSKAIDISKSSDDDSDDSDVPIMCRTAVSNKTSAVASSTSVRTPDNYDGSLDKRSVATGKNASKPTGGTVVKDDSGEDSDVPLSRKIKKSKTTVDTKTKQMNTKKPASTTSGSKRQTDSSNNDRITKKLKKEPVSAKDVPKPSTATIKMTIKSENGTSTPKKSKPTTNSNKAESIKDVQNSSQDASQMDKQQDGDESDENDYKWWLDHKKDNTVKWTTLSHNGPYFPPLYTPHGIKMLYNNVPISLSPASEEVASFFAALIGTDWASNITFQKNFFRDFLGVLKETDPSCPVKTFEKCDFSPIAEYLADQREKKKTMSKEEKAVEKQAKAEIDNQYGWLKIDGRKEKVGNFRVEPPGLFRGRGEHPRTGSLKLRVQPEQVTINIGADSTIPEPPRGHKWGSIINDNTVTWLAMWKENVNNSFKYIFLAANSSLKGQSDFKKFEKARVLKSHVDNIRRVYTDELKDKLMANRQRATALYFIDRLALRAGNEKGDDEADTVGCCSLRYEHITLKPPNKVVFDFLGKDSIRYYNEMTVDDQVFKNINIFKRDPKREGDPLFDRLNTAILNKYLNKFMEGLTAKVFRTYNASHTFQEELRKTPVNGTVSEKLLAYNRANRQVAILCNHQRSVPKGHSSQIAKLQDKILAIKYDLMKVKQQMLELDPKLKKTRPELQEPESDLDDEFIENHTRFLEECESERLQQRLDKENEKRKEDGLPLLKELPEKRTSSITSIEKLEKKYATLCDRIAAQKTSIIDKDENKTTALGTSKINYIDPRISAAWCHKHNVPLDKIFTKSLREKFTWAMDAEKDWEF